MEQNFNGYEGVNVTLPPQKQRKSGLAIASLILGIVSLVGLCCCGINIITAPLAIIFGIVVLAKRQEGTGLAIFGIVTAVLSLLVIVGVFFSIRDLLPYSEQIATDYMQLIEEQDEVFPAYEADGTLPDYLKKYTEPPYSDYFAKHDITFNDIMDALLEQYKSGALKNGYVSVGTTSGGSDAGGQVQVDPDSAILLPA